MFFVFFRHVLAFLFSLLFSLYLIPGLIKTALKFKIVDFPDGNLKKHKKPTPYLGGVAIYISFILTLMLIYPLQNNILWIVLGITILLFIGLVDDFHVLKPYQKFLGQLIVVFSFLINGFFFKPIFFSDKLNFFLSGFWMLSVINAINLIDVMDGLATLIAIMSTISFLIVSLILQEYFISLFLTAMVGALLGFFYYNKPSAKIYLGDAGSLFLGGFLSAVPLIFPWSSVSWDTYYVPVIILTIPLLEVAFLVLIRTYKRLPFYYGSPDHFCLYLRNKGWSVNKILLFTLLVSVILLIIAILFLLNVISFLTLFIFCLLFFIGWILIIYI